MDAYRNRRCRRAHCPPRRGFRGPPIAFPLPARLGSKAILEGARLLLTGRVRAVVAGGIDAESPLTEAGFSALGARSPGRALPFDARRTGMHLGEGGGFLLMMLAQTGQAYFGGIPDEGPEVRLAGWGETSDAHHICAPHPEGAGARAAIEAAIRNGAPHPVGFALLHGTATAQNDAMEARAMMAAAPAYPQPASSAMSVISWPVQAPLMLLSPGAFSKVWDQRLLISPVLVTPRS